MFKKPHLKGLVLVLCLLFAGVTKVSTAEAGNKLGGVNGGGGNGIVALFKTRALELSRALLSFDESSQKLLGFSVNDLSEALNDNNGFFVLCATDEKLEEIKKEKKMARVFNEVPGTVFLNCSDYSNSQWKEKLDWSKVENAVFILHEGMRIMDMAGENNYGFSKNYIEAQKHEDKITYDKLAILMNSNPRAKCFISFGCREMLIVSNYCRADFYYNGSSVFSKIYSTDIREFNSQILNKSTKVGREANADLVSTLRKVNCD